MSESAGKVDFGCRGVATGRTFGERGGAAGGGAVVSGKSGEIRQQCSKCGDDDGGEMAGEDVGGDLLFICKEANEEAFRAMIRLQVEYEVEAAVTVDGSWKEVQGEAG